MGTVLLTLMNVVQKLYVLLHSSMTKALAWADQGGGGVMDDLPLEIHQN